MHVPDTTLSHPINIVCTPQDDEIWSIAKLYFIAAVVLILVASFFTK